MLLPAGYDGNSHPHNDALASAAVTLSTQIMARKPPRTVKRRRPDAEPARDLRSRQQGPAPAPARPNVALLALSLAGAAVAGYLTYTGWTGDRAAYCEAGGGCDIVQSSQWATFLRVPTALWGLLLYAGLAYIAFRVSRPIAQWRRAWVLAFIGWGVSVYLTAISVFVIQATCPYCLGSLAIFTAIIALLLWQRPDALPRSGWPKWLLQTAIPAVIVIAALHAQASDRTARGPEDPYRRGLAERLAESGAVFYGASWCPHCQEQKALFGASQERLPYVECSPSGPRGAVASACASAGVRTYPTWVFADGSRLTAVMSLRELADRVGYKHASEGTASAVE
jgi:uncharacterized membrane protein/glutaredoxin